MDYDEPILRGFRTSPELRSKMTRPTAKSVPLGTKQMEIYSGRNYVHRTDGRGTCPYSREPRVHVTEPTESDAHPYRGPPKSVKLYRRPSFPPPGVNYFTIIQLCEL